MRICVGVQSVEISLIHVVDLLNEREHPHGHTYYIDLCVEGFINEKGYIIDLRELEKILGKVLESYDRKIIVPRDYDISIFPEDMRKRVIINPLGNATIENIAIDIIKRIYEILNRRDLKLYLRLREGGRYFVEVSYP